MRIYRTNINFCRTGLTRKSKLDEKVQAFVDRLAHPDRSLLNAFKLTFDGRVLTEQETKRFISFIRSELNDKEAPPRNTSS